MANAKTMDTFFSDIGEILHVNSENSLKFIVCSRVTPMDREVMIKSHII